MKGVYKGKEQLYSDETLLGYEMFEFDTSFYWMEDIDFDHFVEFIFWYRVVNEDSYKRNLLIADKDSIFSVSLNWSPDGMICYRKFEIEEIASTLPEQYQNFARAQILMIEKDVEKLYEVEVH